MEIKRTKLYYRNGIIYIDTTLSELGRIRFSTGLQWTELNRAKVLVEAQKLIYEFLGFEKKESKKITFESIGAEFLAEIGPSIKKQTLIKYQSNLESIKAHFKNKDIRLYKQEDLRAYANANASQPYKVAFLNRLISYIREAGINTNLRPLKFKAQINPMNKRKILPLNINEIKAVLANAQGEFRDFLQVAFFTGARTGELLALKWEHIDYENESILICQSKERCTGEITTTKTKASRNIDMLPIVKQALLRLKQAQTKQKKKDGFIFSLSALEALEKWKELLASLEMEPRALYQTRHTFATLMLTNKEELLWISTMLGHKSLSTTLDFYCKYVPKKQARAQFLNTHFNESDGEV